MISGLCHVAVRSADILKSARWYAEVLGLEEAFRMTGADGAPSTIYMYIAPGEYIELFGGGTREGDRRDGVTGLCHICLKTGDIQKTYDEIRERGGTEATPIRTGGSRCLMFWIRDPDGNEIEIMEMPPESLQAQADRRMMSRDQPRSGT